MNAPTRAEDQLLAVLVMDFGYIKEPRHGHSQLRHQLAWTIATKGMDAAQVESSVSDMLRQVADEKDAYDDHWLQREALMRVIAELREKIAAKPNDT